MAKVTYIKAEDAPTPPKASSKSAQQSLEILKSIPKGQVAVITPDGDQTLRGLKSSLSRVAMTNKIEINYYEVDGSLYLSLK